MDFDKHFTLHLLINLVGNQLLSVTNQHFTRDRSFQQIYFALIVS